MHISTETTSSDDVRVSVRAAYKHQNSIKGAHICLLERASHEQGIGIFVPSWTGKLHDYEHLKFDVTLTFPARLFGPVKHIRTLDVNTPMYSINAGELQDKIIFDHVILETSNSPITAKSLSCDIGSLRTQNAAITGTFSSITSLSLTTSNGAINSTIDLTNKLDHTPSTLALLTTNDRIDARVGLSAPAPYHGAGSRFKVSARTENAPLALAITDMPPRDAELALSARTKGADAQVHLHPAFEGHFDVRTSTRASAELVEGRATDPAGLERRRSVQIGRAHV